MVGSFDYYLKQFNHVTQSNRQLVLVSNLLFIQLLLKKVFPLYLINDAPIAVNQINTGEEIWDPKILEMIMLDLYLCDALVKSKNLVSKE